MATSKALIFVIIITFIVGPIMGTILIQVVNKLSGVAGTLPYSAYFPSQWNAVAVPLLKYAPLFLILISLGGAIGIVMRSRRGLP